MNIAKYIDHTILKPEATVEDVKKLCKEAKEYNFASVCVNGCYAKLVSSELMGTDVKTCVVVGFPLGAMTKEAKAFETNQAIENGATEIDMVINVGALKDKNYSLLKEDIEAVVNAAKGKALVKVIIETCLLTDEEKVKACEIAKEVKADFVKTSTGFSTGGATKEDIALMRKTVGPDLGVKASGGVRDFKAAMDMINAGASRIGASASISIVSESK
ncbi:deoxyribose-phosphate aldolase [Clostridium beijerinckii]|uniref:Deoxyribose-phosphate aldolase n=1 Tax=Clostridium beijerinckii TaxID=1520 RepID=A0AB74VD07_CLOBE|nr:deoxyribose-phosphate aldolase [Clostridium beijerinckii]NRZ28641.1 deoxyribose-phosphate aldolase [Clostridium beijerinckii]NYB95583.1 deoxyribose-phosphate aldolase [Clostridium beijerinckii]OOM21015.1 deoxyribose-phosphate aldolase 1 [Clostridium beijerinckii]QUN34333.1 deoxyribose-phosphate aldolase [Clostridium beijerinckii]SQB00726.1 deoxyribose-phosphate aldolase [Clostridium beijerinckii]